MKEHDGSREFRREKAAVNVLSSFTGFKYGTLPHGIANII